MHDYSETREFLLNARGALERAHTRAGRTNLPPAAAPGAVRAQIEEVEAMIHEAALEIEAARAACARAGRRGLTLV